jgi:spore germination cell wall hydrolase CwlJ-like protein
MKKVLMIAVMLASTHIQAYTWKDAKCLADNAFYEARGEGIKGMQAVMDVTLNRKDSKMFPNTVCKVVYQKHQFSWTKQKQQKVLDKELQEEYHNAMHLARGMLIGHGRGITKGALWYHEKRINPKWTTDMRRTKKIKNHIFYVANL